MNIYDVNKFLSSKNKSKLIAHFWDCTCHSHDVNNLVKKIGTTQSNISRHITALLEAKVLNCKQEGKARFYKINSKWKSQWKNIVGPQVEHKENKKFKCKCKKDNC